jgi:predicted TIM-barrel fold metal-dependent hydrolase
MQTETVDRILALIDHLEGHCDRLVVDADTHITRLDALSPDQAERLRRDSNYYHGRPISVDDLLTEMAVARVNMSLCWQNPIATPYTDDPEFNFNALLDANRYVHESAVAHPTRIIPGGWTDPAALGVDRALRLVDVCVQEFGCLFVKMNPAQNRYPIDSGEVLAVVDRIVELGAIPAFHFGADTPFTPSEGLEAVASRHPDHPLLAIHMGGGGASYTEAEELYQEARELGLRRPNIRYVLSAKRDTHIESDLITYQMAGEPYSRNLFCASDAPYGRQTWNFGGFRLMFRSLMDGGHPDPRLRTNPRIFTPEAVQNYLGRNFVRFAVAGYRALLERAYVRA